MIATGIFLLLLATALSGFTDRRAWTLGLFAASWVAIALLFAHHATRLLGLGL